MGVPMMRYGHGLILALTVAGIAAPAWADDAAPSNVYLSVQYPDDVGMDVLPPVDPDRTESPTATLNLANLGDTPATWQADPNCRTSWTVTDPSGAVIDQSAACAPGTPAPKTLTSGGQEQDSVVTPLHVFKYQEGTKYTIHLTYFGIKGDATFTIHHEQ